MGCGLSANPRAVDQQPRDSPLDEKQNLELIADADADADAMVAAADTDAQEEGQDRENEKDKTELQGKEHDTENQEQHREQHNPNAHTQLIQDEENGILREHSNAPVEQQDRLANDKTKQQLGPTGPTVWVCSNGSGDFTTLEAAVCEAVEGTTVMVGAGLHQIEASLEVVVSMSIVSDEQPVIQGFDLIECSTEGVHLTLRGLKLVVPASDDGMGSSCIVVRDGTVAAFECCLISHQYHGLEVSGNAQVKLTDCRILDCAKNGVDCGLESICRLTRCIIKGSGDHGIRLTDSGKMDLEECLMTANRRDGIDINGSAAMLMKRCVVTDNVDSGVFTYNHASLKAEQCCVFSNRTYGVHSADTSWVLLNDAEVYLNIESNLRAAEAAVMESSNVRETVGALTLALLELVPSL